MRFTVPSQRVYAPSQNRARPLTGGLGLLVPSSLQSPIIDGANDGGVGGPVRKAAFKERSTTPPYAPRRRLPSQPHAQPNASDKPCSTAKNMAARRGLSMQSDTPASNLTLLDLAAFDLVQPDEACAATPLEMPLGLPTDSAATLESPALLTRAIDELSTEDLLGLLGGSAPQPPPPPPPLSAQEVELALSHAPPPILEELSTRTPPSPPPSCLRQLTPAEFCAPLVRDLAKVCEANESKEAAAFWQAQLEVLQELGGGESLVSA